MGHSWGRLHASRTQPLVPPAEEVRQPAHGEIARLADSHWEARGRQGGGAGRRGKSGGARSGRFARETAVRVGVDGALARAAAWPRPAGRTMPGRGPGNTWFDAQESWCLPGGKSYLTEKVNGLRAPAVLAWYQRARGTGIRECPHA